MFDDEAPVGGGGTTIARSVVARGGHAGGGCCGGGCAFPIHGRVVNAKEVKWGVVRICHRWVMGAWWGGRDGRWCASFWRQRNQHSEPRPQREEEAGTTKT